MDRCGHLLSLRLSAQPSTIKRLAAALPTQIRMYSSGGSDEKEQHGRDERAPSTADEFRRVAEEKKAAAAEKAGAEDGAQESMAEDTDLGSVKEDYKKTQGKAGIRTTGNDRT